MRVWREIDRVGETHKLGTAGSEGLVGDRKKATNRHALNGRGRPQDWSGCAGESCLQGAHLLERKMMGLRAT